jgi:hypothetical protein
MDLMVQFQEKRVGFLFVWEYKSSHVSRFYKTLRGYRARVVPV